MYEIKHLTEPLDPLLGTQTVLNYYLEEEGQVVQKEKQLEWFNNHEVMFPIILDLS